MTPERAREIFVEAKARTGLGPWSDQLRNVMTADERMQVLEVWKTMPGSSCFFDALNKIARGEP